jgi:hypothetical protein
MAAEGFVAVPFMFSQVFLPLIKPSVLGKESHWLAQWKLKVFAT